MEEDIIEKCKKSRLPEGEEYIFGEEALLQEDLKVLEKLINKKYTKNLIEIVSVFDEKDNMFVLNKKEIQAIENLIKGYKELEEYKKYAELTKISCCTAQNCEALNNAIREGIENQKLREENHELEIALIDMVNQFADTDKEEKQLYTMGLSALENAFSVLDIDEGIKREDLWKLQEGDDK